MANRTLFEQTEINGLTLRNRFVRSATWTGLAAEDGAVTPRLVERMVELATGGVGLIITGHSYVQKRGQAGPWQLGVHDDLMIPGLRQLTDAVHDCGGKIVMQLAHAGIYAAASLNGIVPAAVSEVNTYVSHDTRCLTITEIEELVLAFGVAAKRAKAAGFDGAQIHAAHGYLLNQFLSPDYIALCRPLIREPDLVKRWRSGSRKKAACISDNLCMESGLKGNGVSCISQTRSGGT